MPAKRSLLLILAVPVLLLIPLVGNLISPEFDWSLSDFVVMGFMLLVVAIISELILRQFKSKKTRLIGLGLILLVFFLVWAELAVGIFGTWFAGS